jgi:hypothetical protein
VTPARARAVALGRDLPRVPVTVIGHPFAPIGMGEQMRSHVASCLAARLEIGVYDIYRYAQRGDDAHHALIGPHEISSVRGGIRIFHVNGDEVDEVLATFARRGNDFDAGYNIVVPAWELPRYPAPWAEKLRRFDEVWALSHFVRDSLAAAGLDSTWIGQSVDMPPGPFVPRRWFGIRESAFVLLQFFDLSSYSSRKNPRAVVELLDRVVAESPFLDIQLVLKVKDGDQAASSWAATLPPNARIKVIDTPLDTFAVRSLIRACDCFVSLHRAEGFGRGLGEAMSLARVAMGTGWSGNLDFMTPENSLLVRNRLIPLGPDEYPHAAGQSWADPDIGHAHELLAPLLRDPARGRGIALRVLDRLERIVEESATPQEPPAQEPPRRARKATAAG